MTNNDLQNITQKTKDLATRTTLKTGVELMCSITLHMNDHCNASVLRVTFIRHPIFYHSFYQDNKNIALILVGHKEQFLKLNLNGVLQGAIEVTNMYSFEGIRRNCSSVSVV